MGRKNNGSRFGHRGLVPVTMSADEARERGLSHNEILPARRSRDRFEASRNDSDTSLLVTAWNIGKFVVKWSPLGIDVRYALWWRKHSKSKVAMGGAALLYGSQLWLAVSDHDPSVYKSDTVQTASVEIGTRESVLGTEAARVKNATRAVVHEVTAHKVFNDNRRLSDIAETLSEQRGYLITVEGLAELNQSNKILKHNRDGSIDDWLPVDWRSGAVVRLRVPGPIYDGYLPVDESHESLKDIAEDTKADMTDLRRWNSSLGEYSDDADLPEGTLVKVKETINTGLVLRKMTKDDGDSMRDVLHAYASSSESIVNANASLMGVGEDAPDKPGEVAFLPFKGSLREKDKPYFSAAAIRAAFNTAGDPLKITIKVKGKKPSPTQTQRNRKKPNSSVEAQKSVTSIANATDIPADIKAAMMRQYKDSKHFQPALLAGQIWQESRYGKNATSPAGAKGPAQFMPGTWKTEGRDGNGDGKKDPYNPDDAFKAQVDYMDDMYEWAQGQVNKGTLRGDVETLALQAYNRGAGKVKKLGHVATKADYDAGRVPTMENVEYPIKIKKKARQYGYRG